MAAGRTLVERLLPRHQSIQQKQKLLCVMASQETPLQLSLAATSVAHLGLESAH